MWSCREPVVTQGLGCSRGRGVGVGGGGKPDSLRGLCPGLNHGASPILQHSLHRSLEGKPVELRLGARRGILSRCIHLREDARP